MPGSLALVLHGHLPWVRHPEHEDFLEEDWLYEAIAECYLPLLDVFDRLEAEGVDFRLTWTLSPPLLAMLQDPLLMARCERRLSRLVELGDRELQRTRGDEGLQRVARFHRDFYAAQHDRFEHRHRRELLASFRHHADAGRLELITSGATHGFLPLMQDRPEAVRAQIAIGREAHRRALGREPTGIWLPECGYFPGLEEPLADEGLRYFFLESHGLLWGTPTPPGGVHLPVYTPTGVAAFARDPASSQEVWSAEVGFPGHPDYREFHRDLGFELPWEDVGPWMLATGQRRNTGFRYHRVTGPGPDKALYDPERAAATARAHAREFVERRAGQLAALHSHLGDAALVVAPYDAELFGHWWFEGPLFLEEVLRRLAAPQSPVRTTTPPEYLQTFPSQALCTPAESSWGREGHASTWLDPVNDWILGEVNACADLMVELANHHRSPTPLESRALAQAARELLLAQSSDWAFILRAGTTLEYATRRVREHVEAFRRLAAELEEGSLDAAHLALREAQANPFPWLDGRVYASRPPDGDR